MRRPRPIRTRPSLNPEGRSPVPTTWRRGGIEEDLLAEWVPIFDRETSKWILTVVTKADLWWPERARAEKHYVEGAYAEALGEFKPLQTVLPYCSRIEPFYGTNDGKFGETLKVAFRNHSAGLAVAPVQH